MPCFTVDGLDDVAGSATTQWVLDVYNGGTVRRIKLFQADFSARGGSAGADVFIDQSLLWSIQRHITANPTGGTTATPVPFDPADSAAALSAAVEASGGAITAPTGLTDLFVLPLALRLPYKWVAVREGREFIAAAAANSGLGINHGGNGTFTDNVYAVFHFEE